MKRVILANREDCRNVEAEEKYEFTLYVLESVGLPEEMLDECFPDNGYDNFSVEHKIKLRQLLATFDIAIIDDTGGGLKIYVDKDLIAEWKKCKFCLRRDLSKVDPSKQLYVEIHEEFWTIFDENQEKENDKGSTD